MPSRPERLPMCLRPTPRQLRHLRQDDRHPPRPRPGPVLPSLQPILLQPLQPTVRNLRRKARPPSHPLIRHPPGLEHLPGQRLLILHPERLHEIQKNNLKGHLQHYATRPHRQRHLPLHRPPQNHENPTAHQHGNHSGEGLSSL
jgi:hypothetical protein